jgi:uncharacterized protein involved in exopolysaccharide biosynthesis
MQTEQSNKLMIEISLRDILLFLWEKKYVISAVTIVCTLAAVILALTTQPLYVSEAKLVVQSSAGKMSQVSGIAALAGISLGQNQKVDPSDCLDIVLQDEAFLHKIIDCRWFYRGDSLLLVDIWKMKPDTAREHWQFIFEKAKIEKIRKGKLIKLVKNEKTGILTLTTLFPDAQLTFDISSYVIKLFGDYLLNSTKIQAKEKRLFIEDQIRGAKKDLEASENSLSAFRERNTISSSPKVMTEDIRLIRQVNINQEIYLELEKQYKMAQIEEKNDQPLIEVIKNPEIPAFPVKPKKKMIVIMGFFTGIFCGIFFASAMQWFHVNFGKATKQ